jgi:hypothetical protein
VSSTSAVENACSPSWPPALGWSPWAPSEGPSFVVAPEELEDLGSGRKLVGLEEMARDCRISLGERFKEGEVLGEE